MSKASGDGEEEEVSVDASRLHVSHVTLRDGGNRLFSITEASGCVCVCACVCDKTGEAH